MYHGYCACSFASAWNPMLLFLLLLRLTLVECTRLHLASVVFRHGDRTPIGTFPTDPYKESFWPQGFGQLTKKGMQQQYDLGEYLRSRYTNSSSEMYLFNGTYVREEVYVRSTDRDRTLMSAECQMASFYKPTKSQMFLRNLTWQPVSIHTVAEDEDTLLHASSVNCPWYEQFEEQLVNDPEWVQKREDNQELLDYVKNKTGVSYDMTIKKAARIADILFCQRAQNLPLPEWCSQEQYDKLQNISAFLKMKRFEGLEAHRLTAGIFVNEILTHMQQKEEGNQNLDKKKFFIYSAHDSTLAAVLSALKVYDGEIPPYASAVMIELYSNTPGGYFIKIFYHKGPNTTMPPLLLTLPGCNSSCPLSDFAKLVSPVLITPKQWEEECQLSNSSNWLSEAVKIGLIFGSVIFIFMVVSVCKKRRKKRQ